jgi:phosphoglycolate phosphatase-like HAD superfamily hydrolase
MIVILDFDGTLTAEEEQARPLAERSLTTLAHEILDVPRCQLNADYAATRARLLSAPHCYWWEVNGLVASYCDEGAFILNTTTLQVMLRDHPTYRRAVDRHFAHAEYDPVVDCTNYLFHRHTAELPPRFRPGAHDTIEWLQHQTDHTPLILTNSLGAKVARHLALLGLDADPEILGDTRQYDMQPDWSPPSGSAPLAIFPLWHLSAERREAQRSVDLRRPAYHAALIRTLARDPQVAVVADTFSLPGALALQMGIRFFLLATPYTPDWCVEVVHAHPLGRVLESLAALPAALSG